MGLGVVAIADPPTAIRLKVPFSDGLGGVQTFIWMTEDNIVEVPFDNLDNYDNYSLNLRLIKK